MSKFGIVYLSFGKTYVDCTIAAIRSKIANAPRTPAKILTNRKADLDSKICKKHGIEVEYVDVAQNDVRDFKTQLYKYSPYEYTLLLDADAWVNTELADQFKMLDFTPMALTHAFFHPSIGTAAHIGGADKAYTLKAVRGLRYMPQYSSGMVFFRRDDPNVRRLFDQWNKEWRVLKGKDQAALLRAIVKTEVYPLVLARQHWMTDKEGSGFISHRFTRKLPNMPRKDAKSPLKHRRLP